MCDANGNNCYDSVDVNVAIGNSYSAAQLSALQEGYSLAYDLLGALPDCAGALAPPFEATGLAYSPGWAVDYTQGTLASTTYRILPLNPGVGAVTLNSNDVAINQNGAFFATPDGNGNITFKVPSPTTGLPVTVTLPEYDFQAFMMLHELGHQTGVSGPDVDNTTNGQNSWKVLENCFGLTPP
jgi:hypothetical protein